MSLRRSGPAPSRHNAHERRRRVGRSRLCAANRRSLPSCSDPTIRLARAAPRRGRALDHTTLGWSNWCEHAYPEQSRAHTSVRLAPVCLREQRAHDTTKSSSWDEHGASPAGTETQPARLVARPRPSKGYGLGDVPHRVSGPIQSASLPGNFLSVRHDYPRERKENLIRTAAPRYCTAQGFGSEPLYRRQTALAHVLRWVKLDS